MNGYCDRHELHLAQHGQTQYPSLSWSLNYLGSIFIGFYFVDISVRRPPLILSCWSIVHWHFRGGSFNLSSSDSVKMQIIPVSQMRDYNQTHEKRDGWEKDLTEQEVEVNMQSLRSTLFGRDDLLSVHDRRTVRTMPEHVR